MQRFDVCATIPVLACAYAAFIGPLIYFFSPAAEGLEGLMASRIENRIFWPALSLISIVLAVRYWSRARQRVLPPNIVCLIAYLAFAGASTSWAFRPEISFVRFAQEAMVLTSIVVPAMLAVRTSDIMRGIFLCFALAAVVNACLIPGDYVTTAKYGSVLTDIGYQGYFTEKNSLGEFAAGAVLLSIHELLYPGRRRVIGTIISVIAVTLLYLSSSKTALGLALFAPMLAALTLFIGRSFRISPAIILTIMACGLVLLSHLTGFDTDRIAYVLTGDSSFTGRTTIWDFAETEIARNPVLGYGYQSFWLVGPDAPSIVDAPGWVKNMPNAHNGYYDTKLEMGYVGLAFLVVFILTTLHAIGRVAVRDYRRAWLLLSLALFIIIYNFLETLWMRAFTLLWVVFVIVAVEAARYWQPAPVRGPVYKTSLASSARPGRLSRSSAQRIRLRPRLGARS
jgi:exopolysaccharide production protein ExoQ